MNFIRFTQHKSAVLTVCIVFAAALSCALVNTRRAHGQGGAVPVTTVSSASFAPNAPVAPESIVAAFGVNLATRVEVATKQPLPTQLAGTTVRVNGQAAPLFFVSPDQINYLIPAGVPTGTASVVVTSGDGKVSNGTVQIAAAAPALFAANANGLGALASQLLRVKANGQFIYEPLAQYSDAEGRSITRPIDFGDATDRLFLVLYLTGARNAPLSGLRVNIGGVDYTPVAPGAVAVSGFTGLDQINVELPRDFTGRGRISLLVKSAGYNGSNAGEFEIGAGATSNTPLQIAPLPPSPVTVGDEIEISGAGFAANPRENTVQIVADGGVTTKADVIGTAGGSLRIRIPFGAGTGQIKVRRGQDEASAKIQVRTSISGFVEEPKQQSDGSVIRVPIPGVKVQLDGNPASERVVSADGSFVLPQPPIGKVRVVFIPPSCNIPNCPSPVYSISVLPDRDNQFERGMEITGITSPLLLAQADEQAALLNAPDATLTFLLPGRTPANLPVGHFSTRIAQLTPFGVPISPPTKITFPNADGIPVGPVGAPPRLFKFDQTPTSPTLGQFLDIGAATVSADGQTVETAPGAITEGSYYFVSIPRPTAAINGRVVESDGRPVPRAIVQTRGQSTFTDGFGGFVLPNVPVLKTSGDKVRVEVSYQRPNGFVSRKDSNEVELTAGALVTVTPEIVLGAVTTDFPPVILAPSSLALQIGETRDFDFVATDPDSAQAPQVTPSGTAASFTTLSSQGQGVYRLHLTTGANPAGSYTLSLRATDATGATATQNIAVTLNPNSNAPVAQAQSITTPEDTAKPITLAGRDPGGRALSYMIVTPPARGCFVGSDTNSCLGSLPSTPNLVYKPTRDYNGADSFTFKVSNGSAESTTATVFIAVTPVNDAPAFCDPKSPDLCPPEELFVNAGNSLSLVITASDVDAESALKFIMAGLPPEATLTPVSRVSQLLSWTPKFTQAGSYTVTFTVTDNDLPPLSGQRVLRIRVISKLAKSSGIEGGYIFSLLNVGSYLFAGTEGTGVFRSANNGQNWIPVNGGLTTLEITSLVASRNVIYAGTMNGVFRSLDFGASWVSVNNGLKVPGLSTFGVAALAVIGDTIFVGHGQGVFRSTDQGQNWVLANKGLNSISLKVLIASGTTLYAGTFGDGVFQSTDLGQNWTDITSNVAEGKLYRRFIVSMAASGNNVYAGPYNAGLYRLASDGRSWSPVVGIPGDLTAWGLTAQGPTLLVGTQGVVFRSNDLGISWMTIRDGLSFYSFALSFLVTGTDIFTSTDGAGILRLAPDGQSWKEANSGLASAPALALAAIGKNLFAGTRGVGVSRSADGGQTWVPVNNGFTARDVYILTVSGTTIYAGTFGGGVYRSTNQGQSWDQLSNGLYPYIDSLVANGQNLFAGTVGGGLYISRNGGASWTESPDFKGLPQIYYLTLLGSDIFAGTGLRNSQNIANGGVFRSTDNGQSWMPASSGLADRSINSLAVKDTTLFAGTDNGVYRSTNRGQSWEPANKGMIGLTVDSLLVSGATILAGTIGDGVYFSTDNGQNWQRVDSGFQQALKVFALAQSEDKIFTGSVGGGLLLNTSGQSWTDTNLITKLSNTVAVSGESTFVGTLGNGVFRSSNQGQTWSSVSSGLPSNANIQSIATNGATVWAATFGNGVYRSSNQGASWTAVNTNLGNLFVNKLFLNGATLYAGTDGGVFRSTDGSNSWQALNTGLSTLRVVSFAANAGVLYVGTDGGSIFRLNSDGQGWTRKSSGLTSQVVTALGVQGNALYAGTSGGGICISTDGGEMWKAVNNQLPPTLNVYAFAVSGRKVYAGSIYGVFMTEDQGQNWKQINAGLLNTFVTGLAVSGDQLYASTASGGVFVSRIP